MLDLGLQMRQGWKSVAVVLGALTAASALTSQEPKSKQDPAPDPGMVLRQNVRRVRVDVAVTDAQGNPVQGLQVSDFRLSEDGKPQSIRQFEWHGPEKTQALLVPRPVLPPHMFMNLPEAPESGPPTVLLYDILNTPLDSQPFARAQMVDFLTKNKGQQTAIFVLSDRLHMVQGFTSDTELLQRAANQPGARPQRSPLIAEAPSQTGMLTDTAVDQAAMAARQMASDPHSAGIGSSGSSTAASLANMTEIMAHMEQAEISSLLDRRVEITLDALMQIGRFLAGVPGRKNLVWYSGSFPASILPNPGVLPVRDDAMRNYTDRMRAATDLLNEAETAVYPVDARGLQANPVYSASQSSGPGGPGPATRNALQAITRFDQQAFAEHSAMDAIGEQTGGHAFYDTNGLERALERASADGSAYYSLLYAPSNAKFDGSVRRISVGLQHRGYSLAYRRSYFADDIAPEASRLVSGEGKGSAESTVAAQSMASAAQFGTPPAHQLVFAARVDAIGAPAAATPEQISALAPYLEQAAKAANRKLVDSAAQILMQQYSIQYSVLASQLDFPMDTKGIYRPHISLAALAFNVEGETQWGINTEIEGAVSASEIHGVLQSGYRAMQILSVPANTAVIRLVVRDESNGRIGSMEIRLPLSEATQAAARTE
jgi:VWFA-related protein